MPRSESRLSWLALFIPLGYLPGYFSGSSPGIAESVAIVIATAIAWWATAWLARPRLGVFVAPVPRARRPQVGSNPAPRPLPAFNPLAPAGPPPGGGPAARAVVEEPLPTFHSEAPYAKPRPAWIGSLVWPISLLLGAWLFASLVSAGGAARVAALGRKEAFSVGIFQQALWWTDHGVILGATYGTSDGSLHRQLGIHFSPLLAMLSPLYKLRPEAATLLWIQALVLGLAALPLYAAARLRIGALGAGLVAIAWWLHPTVMGSPLLGFHDLAFAPIFAFTALWALFRGRWLPYAAALLGLLLVREDLAFFVLLMAFPAAARKSEPRFVWTPILLGIGWLVVCFNWIMPHYRTPALLAGPEVFLGQYFGQWGGTVGSVVAHVMAHPMDLVARLVSTESFLYLATMLRPIGFLLPIPDAAWLAGAQNLVLNVASDGGALKSPLARYSIPVATAFFMALPGALGFWGRRLGRTAADETALLHGSIEERGAQVRTAAQAGDLWSKKDAPPVNPLVAGRAGAPAAAIAVVAALLALFVMRIDRQFTSSPRGDLSDQVAVLSAVPDSVAVLAPDYAYARLANRARFACLGSLEERVLEPAVLGQFDVVVIDTAPGSFEMETYPELVPQLLDLVRTNHEFRETLSAGGLHLFERLKI